METRSNRRALERGAFLLTLDFELAWGSRDLPGVDREALVDQALRTREAVVDPLLDLLVSRGVPATWAAVGHLFLGEARRDAAGRLHPEVVPPRHPWHPEPWLADVPEGDEAGQAAWMARSILERVRDAGQPVGCHGFSHEIYGDPGCARQSADTALGAAVRAAAGLGVRPRAFVFPRNRVGHLDLLAKHGFTCYRGPAPGVTRLPGPAGRLGHLGAVAAGAPPPTVLPEPGPHGLWNIPASAAFLPVHGVRRAIPLGQRVRRLARGVEAAARSRRVMHLWLHPINLAGTRASDPPRLVGALAEVLDRVAALVKAGDLEATDMASLAARAEAA